MNKLHTEIKGEYGDIQFVELSGGYTNKIYLLKGSDPEVVAKIIEYANRDLTEVNCLKLLHHTRVAPYLHDVKEFDSALIIIMQYIEGVASQKILDNNDWTRAQDVYQKLGIRLARDIHSIKYKSGNSELAFIQNQITRSNFIPNTLVEESKKCLAHINCKDSVLVHGDYGPHNSIYSQDNIYIIDWEWGRWGSPLTDISWVYWFVHLHYPNQARSMFHAFIESYIKESPQLEINSKLLKAYALERVWNIISIAENASKHVQEEWIRRLEWTLENNFEC
jgi:tRNA A-37 threonylcarbamoyl transferase component Bud32